MLKVSWGFLGVSRGFPGDFLDVHLQINYVLENDEGFLQLRCENWKFQPFRLLLTLLYLGKPQ